MEEDIKVLEEFIENYNASYPEEEEWVVIYPNQVQAIQGLLDLYNKEKENNRYLRNELVTYKTTLDNYISKDKIKELADDYESKGYIEIAGAMRELLEERN